MYEIPFKKSCLVNLRLLIGPIWKIGMVPAGWIRPIGWCLEEEGEDGGVGGESRAPV